MFLFPFFFCNEQAILYPNQSHLGGCGKDEMTGVSSRGLELDQASQLCVGHVCIHVCMHVCMHVCILETWCRITFVNSGVSLSSCC